MMKNIIFAGTPAFAAAHLEALLSQGIVPKLVLTQPDKKAGRGQKLTISPVKAVAMAHDLPVYQPSSLRLDKNPEAENVLAALGEVDLLIVVAYGLLLPPWLLELPRFGAINVHASCLPRHRGAAPIQRAIEAGDSQTGVGIMQMAKGLDTGDVWLEKTLAITPEMTAGDLHDALIPLGIEALQTALPLIFSGQHKPTPQDEARATYAKKLTKAEAAICWEDSASVICRRIRAFNPVPVAHAETVSGRRLRFYAATPLKTREDYPIGEVITEGKNGIVIACAASEEAGEKYNAICVTQLQEVGKKVLAARDFINGNSLLGERFVTNFHPSQ